MFERNESQNSMLIPYLGALLSMFALVLNLPMVGILPDYIFNQMTGLLALMPIVFFINKRYIQGIASSVSMLLVECAIFLVSKGSNPEAPGNLLFIILFCAIVAGVGIVLSFVIGKYFPLYGFILVTVAAFVIGFIIRSWFFIKASFGVWLNIGTLLKSIATSTFKSLVFWGMVIVLAGLATLLRVIKPKAKKEMPPAKKKEKEKEVPPRKTAREEAAEKKALKAEEAKKPAEPVKQEPAASEKPEKQEPESIYPKAVGGCPPTGKNKPYKLPGVELLESHEFEGGEQTGEADEQAETIRNCMLEYGVNVEFLQAVRGPAFTRYEFGLGSGVPLSKVTSKEKELSYALCGKKIRILAPIPGKKAIGIEVPNEDRATIGFRNALENLSGKKKFNESRVPMVLGMNIDGEYISTDISAMPHMIIAGTTGSGKSVCVNCLINSILYTKSPEQVRLILVDPKMVELGVYEGIPHLLLPVITEPGKVVPMLNWLITEMERRYALLSANKVRHIDDMNALIDEKKMRLEKLPYIVTIIDEFADLMASAGKDVDSAVGRLAAKARAVGIHLILATQRPSADVITGTLKSNLPGRIAFAVSSGINSRIILDEQGAENLLGKGDMLFLDPAKGDFQRIQGAFISGSEVGRVVDKID